jgi:hypothetical protein
LKPKGGPSFISPRHCSILVEAERVLHIPAFLLPARSIARKSQEPYITFTSAGLTKHHEYVCFDQVFLPEFTGTCWLGEVELAVVL